MFDITIEIVKAVLSSAVAIVCLYLSRYRMKRNEEYAEKYASKVSWLLLRLLITWSLKGVSIVMILGMVTKFLDIFIVFYILTPMLIALNLILFDSTDWMWGFMTFVKGFYYLGLIIISTVQFLLGSEEVTVLALGFTLSLAIFEATTALADGCSKMQRAKQIPNNQLTR